MGNINHPNYKIGDVVVITLYGTVGTITKVHKLDQHFVYEVNYSDMLFFENVLQLYSDYEGTIIDVEEITIDIDYQIGDTVLVNGYGKTCFRIVGIRIEAWRYEDDGWEEVTYELTRLSDGEWLEATADEMTLLNSSPKSTLSILQKLQYKTKKSNDLKDYSTLFTKPIKLKKARIIDENQHYKKMVDELLDIYNDYQTLYQMFENPEYKEIMVLIMNSLQRHSKSNDSQH
ncbi:hypothetical protein [Metabacillus niabensis]|uniref:YodN n=1 Tax=Metabacillus niabensis TaxID=324854 RepID=A0ABT9Z0Z5_9BACI|nr:hypothetical protein [Metabacillus niabensis]MDQ0225228.1 hypothetical protein [Metabacillus niabensis]PAD68156.1 hypothetical protein CHH83_15290 [Bacillus sp. 7586-K]